MHGNLLSPVFNARNCPLPWAERWELRTPLFGCNCSTTTFLAAVTTCVSTLLSILLFLGLGKLVKWSWIAWQARGGWVVEEFHNDADTRRREYIWVRNKRSCMRWLQERWRKRSSTDRDEEEEEEALI
jgi:hypothetical protein